MHRTIIVGSPRENGRSAHLAEQIFEACIEDCPKDGISLVSLAGLDVAPCIGCDSCKTAIAEDSLRMASEPEEGDPLQPVEVVAKSDASRHMCVIEDEFSEVRKHIDAADELIVVAPLYFASAPAQLKALMDRLQPYFWSDIRATDIRRPMVLHVVGEGGNPYGYDALATAVRSAFGVVGFRLVRLLDWVGKIDRNGDIIADADEVVFEGALGD